MTANANGRLGVIDIAAAEQHLKSLPLPKYYTKDVWFYQLSVGARFQYQDRLFMKDSEAMMHEHRSFGGEAPPVPAPLTRLVGVVPTEPLRFSVVMSFRAGIDPVILCYIEKVGVDDDGSHYNGGVPGALPPTPPYWRLTADQSGTLLEELRGAARPDQSKKT